METELSLVDGERGILVLRGEPLETLAPRASSESVAALLWSGVAPARAHSPFTERQVEQAFGAARRAAFALVPQLGGALSLPDSMDALRAAIEEFEDGFHVRGDRRLRGGDVDARNDHRLAMAFAIAALGATGPTTIHDAGAAAVSYPEFFSVLESLRA